MATQLATLTTLEQNYLDILEARIKNGLKTFWQVGDALMEIRDKKLYRQNHLTFKEYCEKQWGFTDSRARQFMLAAEVMQDVRAALPARSIAEPENDQVIDSPASYVKQSVTNCNGLVDVKTDGKTPIPPAESKPTPASAPNPTPAPQDKVPGKGLLAAALSLNEGQIRELAGVPREKRAEVLGAAVATAPNGKLTAAHVKEVAKAAKANPKASLGSIIKSRFAKPAPKPMNHTLTLKRQEQRIMDALQTIQAQGLFIKAPANSYDEYLESLLERIRNANEH